MVSRLPILTSLLLAVTGCALVPHVAYEPRYHNPFPQLARVAVLPFFNQSGDPTLNQDQLAMAYYNELQQVPGFEVMPVGVVIRQLEIHQVRLDKETDFQQLARLIGVDALVVGSVTDYSAYYPPRMTLAVNWYAANPCFHPIPPGYGLPWGTPDEKRIPDELVMDAEFALAREQLKTQTPRDPSLHQPPSDRMGALPASDDILPALSTKLPPEGGGAFSPADTTGVFDSADPFDSSDTELLPEWPDARGLTPCPPSPHPPTCVPHHGPIITQVRTFNGHDSHFTAALADYYHFRDDARFGGWQAYLQRSDDFIRFCCYLHIAETLVARGGGGETRVASHWLIDR